MHHVESARWEPGLEHGFGERGAGERRVLTRFQDHSVATTERCRGELSGNVHGEVEGREERVDADRLAVREDPLRGLDAGHHVGLEALGLLRREAEDVGDLGEFVARLGRKRLARLGCHLQGQLFGSTVEHVGDRRQQVGSLELGHCRQLHLSGPGGGDRRFDVGGGCHAYVRNRRSVRRVGYHERVAGRCFAPVAVDEQRRGGQLTVPGRRTRASGRSRCLDELG